MLKPKLFKCAFRFSITIYLLFVYCMYMGVIATRVCALMYACHVCACSCVHAHMYVCSCVCMPFTHMEARAKHGSSLISFTVLVEAGLTEPGEPLLSEASQSTSVARHLVTMPDFLCRLRGFELRTSRLHSKCFY